MVAARTLQTVGDVDFVSVMSGQIGCEQRRHEPHADNHQSEKRQAIANDDMAGVDKPREMWIRRIGGG